MLTGKRIVLISRPSNFEFKTHQTPITKRAESLLRQPLRPGPCFVASRRRANIAPAAEDSGAGNPLLGGARSAALPARRLPRGPAGSHQRTPPGLEPAEMRLHRTAFSGERAAGIDPAPSYRRRTITAAATATVRCIAYPGMCLPRSYGHPLGTGVLVCIFTLVISKTPSKGWLDLSRTLGRADPSNMLIELSVT